MFEAVRAITSDVGENVWDLTYIGPKVSNLLVVHHQSKDLLTEPVVVQVYIINLALQVGIAVIPTLDVALKDEEIIENVLNVSDVNFSFLDKKGKNYGAERQKIKNILNLYHKHCFKTIK